MRTWRSGGPLFEVAVLRTVPPYVTHVPTLETTSVLRLPLLFFYVLVLVVLLLFNPGRESSGHDKEGWVNQTHSVQTHTKGKWQMVQELLLGGFRKHQPRLSQYQPFHKKLTNSLKNAPLQTIPTEPSCINLTYPVLLSRSWALTVDAGLIVSEVFSSQTALLSLWLTLICSLFPLWRFWDDLPFTFSVSVSLTYLSQGVFIFGSLCCGLLEVISWQFKIKITLVNFSWCYCGKMYELIQNNKCSIICKYKSLVIIKKKKKGKSTNELLSP